MPCFLSSPAAHPSKTLQRKQTTSLLTQRPVLGQTHKGRNPLYKPQSGCTASLQRLLKINRWSSLWRQPLYGALQLWGYGGGILVPPHTQSYCHSGILRREHHTAKYVPLVWARSPCIPSPYPWATKWYGLQQGTGLDVQTKHFYNRRWTDIFPLPHGEDLWMD